MKTVSLNSGKLALVDDSDFQKVHLYSWRELHSGSGKTIYAQSQTDNRRSVLMHRMIMNPVPGLVVDHINNNGLDNQRKNLRCITITENLRRASLSIKNKSGFRGVFFDRKTLKYSSRICYNYKNYYLGSFENIEDAKKSYMEAYKKYYGYCMFLG